MLYNNSYNNTCYNFKISFFNIKYKINKIVKEIKIWRKFQN